MFQKTTTILLTIIIIKQLFSTTVSANGKSNQEKTFPTQPFSQESNEKYLIQSPNGYIAESVPAGEGLFDTFIKKDDQIIVKIPFTKAESFSPIDDILIITKQQRKSDKIHRELLFFDSQNPNTLPVKSIHFGGKQFRHPRWSNDGRFIQFIHIKSMNPITVGDKSFSVIELFKSNPLPSHISKRLSAEKITKPTPAPIKKEPPQLKKSDLTRTLKSPNGYIAESYFLGRIEEGRSDTLIKHQGHIIARVEYATPESFSPNGTLLLMHEAEPSDGIEHFLLRIDNQNPEKTGRLRLTTSAGFGGEWGRSPKWSPDSNTITLMYRDDYPEDSRKKKFNIKEIFDKKKYPRNVIIYDNSYVLEWPI